MVLVLTKFIIRNSYTRNVSVILLSCILLPRALSDGFCESDACRSNNQGVESHNYFVVSLVPPYLSQEILRCRRKFCATITVRQSTSSTFFNLEMSDARERTFIMVKPDGVQRGLVGEIIKRFEQKGFKLVAMKFMWPSKELLEKHYADLSSRPFFPGLIQYMSSGPVVPMVWEGLNVVKTGRVMLGATDPRDSAPGTIRGDLCIQVGRNVIHGSDAVESANKEINLWFKPEEIFDWKRETEKWIYEN